MTMNVMACDLEYVQVSGGRHIMAKCAIVDMWCDIVLNLTVRPNERVTNYVTKITGLRQGDLDFGMPYDTALRVVKDVLSTPDIVAFHDPTNDLKVLNWSPECVVDTSRMSYLIDRGNFSRRPSEGVGLKKLASVLLNTDIQGGFHSPVEDAITTMKLYKLSAGLECCYIRLKSGTGSNTE